MVIEYKNCSTKDEAYEKVKSAITPELLDKFKVKVDFNYNDEYKIITASGKGFTLDVNFYDTELDYKLDLSFMLKAFRSGIESTINKQVGRVV